MDFGTRTQDSSMRRPRKTLLRKMAQLKALVLDVDGVLTDGRVYYGQDGIALKAFDVRDGLGLVRLRESGLRIALLSSDRAALVERRAEKLGIADVQQGVQDKREGLRAFVRQHQMDFSEVGYMGDDLNDLPAFDAAGVTFAPADSAVEVLRMADCVTERPGGRGAVREVADLLLSVRRTIRG